MRATTIGLISLFFGVLILGTCFTLMSITTSRATDTQPGQVYLSPLSEEEQARLQMTFIPTREAIYNQVVDRETRHWLWVRPIIGIISLIFVVLVGMAVYMYYMLYARDMGNERRSLEQIVARYQQEQRYYNSVTGPGNKQVH
jgi:ABC-type antimicrobial peptide transport system permease subunit